MTIQQESIKNNTVFNKIVSETQLYQKVPKSNLVGKQNGVITITEFIGYKSTKLLKYRKHEKKKVIQDLPFYKYKCICGKEGVFAGKYAVTIKSCGCNSHLWLESDNIELIRRKDYQAFRSIYLAYRYSAKRKKRTFELTQLQFFNIVQQNCYYCGTLPSNIQTNIYHSLTFKYSGIDRKNNSEGYTVKNSLPCCETCNSSKSNMSLKQFLNWIRKVAKYSKIV